MTLTDVLARFPDHRKSGDGFMATCPLHTDPTRSLAIREKDGKVLVHCHGGCDQGKVAAAAGLLSNGHASARQVDNVYTYHAADGSPAFEVVRYWPKDFRQRRPDGSWGVQGVDPVPYNLPAVLASDRGVVVVEGEKDVDRLASLGIVATCNAGGAGKWRPEFAQYLAGRTVVVIPDNDDPGRQHAADVARSLQGEDVRLLELPGLAPKGDVSDWLDDGHSADELRELLREAPPYVAAPSRPTFPVLSWTDLMAAPPDPPPVHRPGIPVVGVVVLAGSPKAGKSLWVSQMVLETRKPALLVIEEGAREGIAYRLRRQAAQLAIESPPISVMYRQRIRLDDPQSVDRLRAHVAETRPALVALDPLNRLHSADENKPSQMTPVMDALAGIAYDFACSVVAVHHVNKPSQDRRGDIMDRLRGASSIRSGTDANLVLDGTGDRLHLVGEFRDAEPLSEWMELDRESLTFRPADAPQVPTKVDPTALRDYVLERRQVVVSQVAERFGVARNTARVALRALGCDEFAGVRGTLTFTLGTAQ